MHKIIAALVFRVFDFNSISTRLENEMHINCNWQWMIYKKKPKTQSKELIPSLKIACVWSFRAVSFWAYYWRLFFVHFDCCSCSMKKFFKRIVLWPFAETFVAFHSVYNNWWEKLIKMNKWARRDCCPFFATEQSNSPYCELASVRDSMFGLCFFTFNLISFFFLKGTYFSRNAMYHTHP